MYLCIIIIILLLLSLLLFYLCEPWYDLFVCFVCTKPNEMKARSTSKPPPTQFRHFNHPFPATVKKIIRIPGSDRDPPHHRNETVRG